MRRLLILLLALAIQSCSDLSDTGEYRDIAELQWRRDGTGMVGLIEYISNTTTVQATQLYDLYSLRTDGTLDKKSTSGYRAFQDVSFTLFMGDDGTSAVAQLGNYSTCRINLSDLSVTEIVPNLHLYAVSPDLRFVVGSYSPPRQPIKTVKVFDVSTSPIREVQSFDLAGIKHTRGTWLDSGRYALAVNDSAGSHIDVFDTAGGRLFTIGDADISNHNIAFFPLTQRLYYRTNEQYLAVCDMRTRESQTLINLGLRNFALTADEAVCYYTYFEDSKIKLKRRRLPAGVDETIADDDIIRGPFLSPDNKRLAYIRNGGINIDVVKVINAE